MPWEPFWIMQKVRHCRWWLSALAPIGWFLCLKVDFQPYHSLTFFFFLGDLVFLLFLFWDSFGFLGECNFLVSILWKYQLNEIYENAKFGYIWWFKKNKFPLQGGVASYQIRLILPSVAQTCPKICPSRCNLQYFICRHAVRKVLSLEYHHSLF